MPISHYSGSKYGESSTNNGGGGSSSSTYYSSSRSRETPSERGRERDKDKEWSSSSGSRGGREWRRGERERSRDRDRDKDRQRSPSRNSSRFASDYNSTSSRERRPERYYSSSSTAAAAAPSTPPEEEQGVRRVSRFGSGGTGKYGDGSRTATASYSTIPSGATSSLIREKDLLQNPGLTNSILHGNQYGSYHFGSQGHFSDFSSYQPLGRKSTTGQEKDPKSDPLFKAALDAIIANIKTKGDYDQVRKECFSDIDTKVGRSRVTAKVLKSSGESCWIVLM